eukprot:gnl/TRDRNA2_/TRDRNA2_188465_c0_seq1.p1 gnl/TRDRNA2_/TRDRNA2_188465_c0~~gnl/TRDRNA2_/TRDRNA2_188465_c0_seq1.p1  ORF type:complete len:132 (-),score=28.51 gnl/TRDRNA2_/TRDRNA2_188465_c0_seq1:120-515(-)
MCSGLDEKAVIMFLLLFATLPIETIASRSTDEALHVHEERDYDDRVRSNANQSEQISTPLEQISQQLEQLEKSQEVLSKEVDKLGKMILVSDRKINLSNKRHESILEKLEEMERQVKDVHERVVYPEDYSK